MPEGPEITYISKYITHHFHYHTLHKINIMGGRYKNHGVPSNYKEFVKSLPLKLTNVAKKGKVLFLYFGEWCLISKLGMTGWWFVPGDEPQWRKPVNTIILEFDNNKLIYTDIRSYGTLSVINDKDLIQKQLDDIAPDILSNKNEFPEIRERIANLSENKKKWLLEDIITDQKTVVSGIGNYLKAEILYAVKISPLRKCKDVSIEDWKKIYITGKKIATNMLKLNGTNKYFDSMKVYKKERDPYGNGIVTHMTKRGRTTWWCPAVQK